MGWVGLMKMIRGRGKRLEQEKQLDMQFEGKGGTKRAGEIQGINFLSCAGAG